ncbi:4Fe-4S binding protein [Streptomyces sp. NPDC051940]|uniref:DUF362 domain-containing protein n=1 Tax=Streptomyces sp. NPDC051940 TaxID=3155675 RepID=UPI00342ED42C
MTPPDGPAPVTVTARCAGCGACLLTCPTHAIRPHGGTLLVRAALCTGCLECVDVCPVDAIDENAGFDAINRPHDPTEVSPR